MKSYRDDPILMKCGHPRAARMIVATATVFKDRRLETQCWACEVEREIRDKREIK